MAAVLDMGEVDEIHSKEENSKDEILLNGNVSSNKSSEKDESENKEEAMEVDEVHTDEHDGKADSIEIDDDDEDEETVNSNRLENSNVQNNKNSSDVEIHSVDNSDNEVDDIEEVHDNDVQLITKETVDDNKGGNDSKKSEKLSVAPKKDDCDNDSVQLNDSGDGDDVEIIESSLPKENGNSHSPTSDQPHEIDDDDDDDDVIPIDTLPKKKQSKTILISSPRRSSRNLNKTQKTYISEESDGGSDIEEVFPEDPLAVNETPLQDKSNGKKQNQQLPSSSTIVVKDTKRLAEIASKSSANNAGKKEPTLVIIDTNSILSGRGPVPVNQKSALSPSYPLLPMALPAQGVYPANMRATITPIPMTSKTTTTQPANSVQTTSSSSSSSQVAPVILPSLTDDMFVVEAPSFIVPYVYEKPPVEDLKETVTKLGKELKELQVAEEKERKEMKKEKSENGNENDDDDESSRDSKDCEITSDGDDKKDDDLSDYEKKLDELRGDDKKTFDLDDPVKKSSSYFESALGKFFMDIGHNLVQEYVQNDLLKQQKKKRDREGGKNTETNKTISSLIKNLEYTKENNEPYHMKIKRCEFCNFKTESSLAMGFHLEAPHMRNFLYRCNFCTYEVRSPHDILFHMEAMHSIRGRLERAPAYHQCPNCQFEDNQKGKLSRHMVTCARKFKPDRNLEPPVDWEPPAKIPRVPRMKQSNLASTAAMYQAMAKSTQMQFMQKMQSQTQSVLNRGRGRPSLNNQSVRQPSSVRPSNMIYKPTMAGGSVLLPTSYQVGGNQLYQNALNKSKPIHQPSISITPLPRNAGSSSPLAAAAAASGIAKPGDSNSKNSFVICEICDGYIKDLEQLRNHMQWIHKVKIHPKMIYNRPPLNCQKCQFRFFADRGLERHLLGSHGLVTSSMQEAANKSKDSGRCPVCGKVYQWKLLNHVARDHSMTLKPAHLSYKCTVCTATFGMYKQFENHVYSAHSVVAKRVMDKKTSSPQANSKNDSLLKPLKINDEITIIPQLPKGNAAGSSKEGSPSTSSTSSQKNSISVTAAPSTSKSSELNKRRKHGRM